MATGYESTVINGQLVPVAPGQAFNPLTYSNTLSGPGYWPRNGQWNVPPLMPSASSQTASSTYSPGAGGVMPTAGAQNSDGSINFFSPTKGPIVWVIGSLALALFLLHKVHYGKG